MLMVAGLMSLAINAQVQTDTLADDAVLEVCDSVAVQAYDFAFETRDGRQLRLSELPAGSPDRLTLLMFYDPDCTDCRQELFAMRHSSQLRQAVRQGRVQVLCVYAEHDEALWRETAGELPKAWMVARATDVDEVHRHYDLSAMPLLLLLNTERYVLQQTYEFIEMTGILSAITH